MELKIRVIDPILVRQIDKMDKIRKQSCQVLL